MRTDLILVALLLGLAACNSSESTGTTGGSSSSSSGGASSSGSGTSTSGGSSSGGSGSGGSSSGGTTGAGTTSGGSSGSTSSTGGTTGGTTGGGQAAGTGCTADGQCASGACGINGTGFCCVAECSVGDATCGAKGCLATSGACDYPTAATNCGSTCTGSTLTSNACNGSGACAAGTPAPCPNNLACNGTGSCRPKCVSGTAQCAAGFYCLSGNCAQQTATGKPCGSDISCASGVCGVTGQGLCCAAACNTTADPFCAASDCDATGACLYQPAYVQCRPDSCNGTIWTAGVSCDGAGGCPAQVSTDCSPYTCNPVRPACFSSCTTNTGNAPCASGNFCDTDNQVCCSGLTKGGTILVDSATGSDATTCCGIGKNGACQTLSHAMVLIDAAQAQDVTILATVNGGGGDWSTKEPYPVTLGWGVELNAPGVFFLDPYNPATPHFYDFVTAAYSANDKVGYASIVGSAQSPVGIGMDSANSQQTDATSTIAIGNGTTLYLANLSVNGSVDNNDSVSAIFLGPSSGLVLGQDQSGAITGTVTIGNALGAEATDGKRGISCLSDGYSGGCNIKDAPLKGQSSVIIQGQEEFDIYAEDFSTISLTSNPVIGVPPKAPGFNNCPQKNDAIGGQAVWLTGLVKFTFNNGTVQCIGGTGVRLDPSIHNTTNGTPTIAIDSSVIQNTELGILVSVGTATVTNSTINYNVIGVEQSQDFTGNDGTVDLSGGGNTVICSSNVETSQSYDLPGVDVYNLSNAKLNASNVTWDTATPDYFDCDQSFSMCTCSIASCDTAPGSDDMDAVEDSQYLGGITTKNPSQAKTGCN